ncbi:uridine kinase [Lentzea fradiae]|uniref:uridine kinase n=1 Tax=Lentzea fradiae TaxID=200378 RepID=UPI001C40A614|nr:uridine kinase [Lentzea fradiae]
MSPADGPPRSPARLRLLGQVADAVPVPVPPATLRVAVDGVDGSGKTVFADELAHVLRERGHEVVRASVDDFHQVRALRYARGSTSAEGFWLDSYDYDRFRAELLEPFGKGPGHRFRRAIHDVETDELVDAPPEDVPAGAILLVDGIFLHRDEVVHQWDFSVFLSVGFDVSVPRMAVRDGGSPDPGHERNRRYVGGQRLYLRTCDPAGRADLVVDNNDLDAPVLSAVRTVDVRIR